MDTRFSRHTDRISLARGEVGSGIRAASTPSSMTNYYYPQVLDLIVTHR
jgi:hypothetical protein